MALQERFRLAERGKEGSVWLFTQDYPKMRTPALSGAHGGYTPTYTHAEYITHTTYERQVARAVLEATAEAKNARVPVLLT